MGLTGGQLRILRAGQEVTVYPLLCRRRQKRCQPEHLQGVVGDRPPGSGSVYTASASCGGGRGGSAAATRPAWRAQDAFGGRAGPRGRGGYSVLLTTATTLITQPVRAHAQGDLEERLRHFAKPKLLIVDKLAACPCSPALHIYLLARLPALRAREPAGDQQSRR